MIFSHFSNKCFKTDRSASAGNASKPTSKVQGNLPQNFDHPDVEISRRKEPPEGPSVWTLILQSSPVFPAVALQWVRN